MEAQHNSSGWFDGVDVSAEVPRDGDDSRTAKWNLRISTPALLVGAVVMTAVWKPEALDRVLEAGPALAGPGGRRLPPGDQPKPRKRHRPNPRPSPPPQPPTPLAPEPP